jgi:hypothetical protein
MIQNFPAPWTVWIHRYDSSARNAHNVPIKAYVPPKGEAGEPVKVIQWEVNVSEPSVDQTVDRVTLYIPPVLRSPDGDEVDMLKTTDLVDLPWGNATKQYEVKGLQDCNHGFHAWQPGYIVQLERATP